MLNIRACLFVSILVVGVMWSNIGQVEDHRNSLEFLPSVSQQSSTEDLQKMSGHKEAMIIFADCTSSLKGLFSGVLLFAISLALLIIHFVLKNSCEEENVSNLIASVTEWTLYTTMLLVTIWAYIKIAKLEINPHPISLLDDLLLLICIPSFVLFALVCFIPDIIPGVKMDKTLFVSNLLMVRVFLLSQKKVYTSFIFGILCTIIIHFIISDNTSFSSDPFNC